MSKTKKYVYKCKLCGFHFKDTIERYNLNLTNCPHCNRHGLICQKRSYRDIRADILGVLGS